MKMNGIPSNNSNHGNSNSGNQEEVFVDVWSHNLEKEFVKIRQIIQKYPYVSMDTEFPGVVARPMGEFRSNTEYQYQLVHCNVNLLKLIQLGLTFYDEKGAKAPGGSTFQFNFKFSLGGDMYAEESIAMLKQAGIQFQRHEDEGIDVEEFAELLMSSGLVLCEEVTWIAFASGYDFGYLIKLLTNERLPSDESVFYELLSCFFPKIYDVKYLMKSCKSLKGGLQEVADQLKLERVGVQHQAGSDSHVTGASFFKIKEEFFDDQIDDEKYCGNLFGFGNAYACNGNGFNLSQ